VYESWNTRVGRSTAGFGRLSLNIPSYKQQIGFLRARTLSQKNAITEWISRLVFEGWPMATIGFFMPCEHYKQGSAAVDQNVGGGLPPIAVCQ
jgi:hypothetical protein